MKSSRHPTDPRTPVIDRPFEDAEWFNAIRLAVLRIGIPADFLMAVMAFGTDADSSRDDGI
jgi:hypothetical protein